MSDGKMSSEMEQFVAHEQQRMMLQQMISQISSECFDKCISTPGRSLSSREQECVRCCTQRWKESSRFIMQYLAARGEQAQANAGY